MSDKVIIAFFVFLFLIVAVNVAAKFRERAEYREFHLEMSKQETERFKALLQKFSNSERFANE